MKHTNTINTIGLIDHFKTLFANSHFVDMDTVSLVSHHDTSIMFTNSTTSVMKPYLLNPLSIPKPGLSLVQPALGMQGVEYWLEQNEFGRYSSFFLSFGVLISLDSQQICSDIVSDFLNAYFKTETIVYKIHPEHKNMLIGLEKAFSVIESFGEDEVHYKHKYGLSNLAGFDILIGVNINEEMYSFGNISVIWNDTKPIAIEFSVDSTLLLSALQHTHSVLCLPAYDVAKEIGIGNGSKRLLPFLDFSELTCMLCIDGLCFGSRGRSGKLKRIFKESIKLSMLMGISERDFIRFYIMLLSLDIEISNKLSNYKFENMDTIKDNLIYYYSKYIIDIKNGG